MKDRVCKDIGAEKPLQNWALINWKLVKRVRTTTPPLGETQTLCKQGEEKMLRERSRTGVAYLRNDLERDFDHPTTKSFCNCAMP